MKNKVSDIELNGLLLAGEDIEYEGFLVRNYSIGDIFKKIKLDKYYYLTGLTVLTPQDMLEGVKPEDIDKLKVYDILLSYPHYNQMFIEFLNTFTYLEWKNGEWNDFVAYDSDNIRYRVNENRFNGLMQLVKKIYVVNRGSKDSSDELDPSLAKSEEARKMVEEFIEFENKKNSNKEKGTITLMGVVNGVCSQGIGYNLFNVWDLKMYQLMAQYFGVEQDKNYDYIMNSVYQGVWDTKKNKINYNDIHWAKDCL